MRGQSLLEVLVGIVIFAVGMLALAQLQGNLSKSSAESNARTVAINIAEETIERARSFSQVTAAVGVDAFNNIVSGSRTETRGGIPYAVTQTVTDYYYNPTAQTFGTTKPHSNIVNADMKRLQLTVAWGAGQSFQVDGSASTTGLGTGSVTLTDLISSITSPSGGKVVLNNTTNQLYGPPIEYTPGQNPDIIPIQLGQNRFKESTKPLPTVKNALERVESKFDVVTYSQTDAGSTFLRREEFLAVACRCTLQLPNGTTGTGSRPAIWNGNDYTEGEMVAKAYGTPVSENNQNFQSEFCTVCCRDHHDGGTGAKDQGADPGRSLYSPFRGANGYYSADDGVPASLIGNHKHYNVDNLGNLTNLADSAGDQYLEVCRLVRKDGFFRAAQDLRQEGLNSFPASFLDETAEVAIYSKYVTDAVSLYKAGTGDNYQLNPPTFVKPPDMSPAVVFPASTPDPAVATVFSTSSPTQQLRSRGIYVDYMNDEVRAIIKCIDEGGTSADCGVKGAQSSLEVLPFFDVQLTWLARWYDSAFTNIPVSVTNETIKDNNVHSRGFARMTGNTGSKVLVTEAHTGNQGLTGTVGIDPLFAYQLRKYDLHALVVNGTVPPPTGGATTGGTITSSVGGVKASDVEISATEDTVSCSRTSLGYVCNVPLGINAKWLIVSNYWKQNKILVACSFDPALTVHEAPHTGPTIKDNWTRFNINGPSTTANIVIREGNCN